MVPPNVLGPGSVMLLKCNLEVVMPRLSVSGAKSYEVLGTTSFSMLDKLKSRGALHPLMPTVVEQWPFLDMTPKLYRLSGVALDVVVTDQSLLALVKSCDSTPYYCQRDSLFLSSQKKKTNLPPATTKNAQNMRLLTDVNETIFLLRNELTNLCTSLSTVDDSIQQLPPLACFAALFVNPPSNMHDRVALVFCVSHPQWLTSAIKTGEPSAVVHALAQISSEELILRMHQERGPSNNNVFHCLATAVSLIHSQASAETTTDACSSLRSRASPRTARQRRAGLYARYGQGGSEGSTRSSCSDSDDGTENDNDNSVREEEEEKDEDPEFVDDASISSDSFHVDESKNAYDTNESSDDEVYSDPAYEESDTNEEHAWDVWETEEEETMDENDSEPDSQPPTTASISDNNDEIEDAPVAPDCVSHNVVAGEHRTLSIFTMFLDHPALQSLAWDLLCEVCCGVKAKKK